MKTLLYTLLIFCFLQQFQAQDNSGYRIIRSNIGSSGSSQDVETIRGIYSVSQSIGQASVIGTHSKQGYHLRQGYQQPSDKVKMLEDFNYNLEAKVYPNPFDQVITISFNHKMLDDISVLIFDINAKIIHSQIFLPTQKVELKLKDISIGNYFLKVRSDNKSFNTKLIKF
jgi:hypothetical protein